MCGNLRLRRLRVAAGRSRLRLCLLYFLNLVLHNELGAELRYGIVDLVDVVLSQSDGVFEFGVVFYFFVAIEQFVWAFRDLVRGDCH